MGSWQQLQRGIPWSAMLHLLPASATSPAPPPILTVRAMYLLSSAPQLLIYFEISQFFFYLVKLHDACAFVLSLQFSSFFFFLPENLFCLLFSGVVGQCSPSSLHSFYGHLLSWPTLLLLLVPVLPQAFVSAATHKQDFCLVQGMKY